MPEPRSAASAIGRAAGLGVIAALALIAAACTSDDGTPTPAPTVTATAVEPTATPSTTPTPVAAWDLDLPEVCNLFDEGRRDPRIVPGEPVRIQHGASRCGEEALDGVAALRVEWTVAGIAGPTVGSVLTPASELGWWEGTVTFPERGTWRTGEPAGFSIDVVAADYGLAEPSPDLPVSSTQHTVVILDGAATEVLRTFEAEVAGVGFLRDPDRAIFVQAREGGRWLVAADLATGDVESLFEVGPFANIASAPDGRAVAVEWGTPVSGERQLRIVTAEGDVAEIDDGSINFISLAWAPDSSALLARGDSLWLLESDGAVRQRWTLEERDRPQAAWSPDSESALLWYGGGQPRLVRLDTSTMNEEVLLDGDAAAALTAVEVSPSGQRVALAWRQDGPEMAHVSVVPVAGLAGAPLDDFIVASFERARYYGLGTLSWSPDGDRIAFATDRPEPSGVLQPAGSAIQAIDLTTSEVRVVAEAPDYYSGQPRHLRWSADGSTLFAVRFNCTGCEASSSALDVIDVAAGRVVETFDPGGFAGMTADGEAALLRTPAGLVRHDVREPLMPPPGGVYFGPQAVSFTVESGDAYVAALIGVTRGQQIFAVNPDGSEVEVLGVFPLERQLAGLLDTGTAVIRGDDGWAGVDLDGGVEQPYAGSSTSLEKTGFHLSPSGHLAIDTDPEGFGILDAADPAAGPVVPQRPYPGDVVAPPAWSPDETRVAFGDSYTIGVFDLESGAEHVFELDTLGLGLSHDDPFDRLWAIAWSPEGSLVFATPEALWRVEVDAGTAGKVVDSPRPGGFTQGTLLAYSPDGRTLAAATQFGVFALHEDGTWRELSALGVGVGEGALRWAPDSSAVAFTAEAAHSPEGIVVAPLDSGAPYRLVAPGAVRLLDWLSDGRIVWVSLTGGV